jgi:hypothetical protein
VVDGLAAGLIAMPLFQTNLLPFFPQVYLMLEAVFVIPAFAHLVPAIEAENAGVPINANVAANETAANFLTRAMSITEAYMPQLVIWLKFVGINS